MSKCDLCYHRGVCHFMGKYMELENSLPETVFPFEASIVCNEYREEKPIQRDYQLQQFPDPRNRAFYGYNRDES
jgi:hypothetical protein